MSDYKSSDNRIRIVTSDPKLKNKVKINLQGDTDVIYWYIRFNIPLDETSVSEKTMEVTDTDGYIMRTDISYNDDKNTIVISPLDTYEQDRYYLLNVSRKVRSAKGQYLKTKIHILFKLYDNKISEYKVLRKDMKVPKAKSRPSNYDKKQINRKPNIIDMEYMDKSSRDRMATTGFNVNVVIGVLGLIIVIFALFLQSLWLIITGAIVCACGMVHIYLQMRNKELASKFAFNRGVRKFNKGFYINAEMYFMKALDLNPSNELAKYGLYKTGLYK
jgi:hypothetical protein